MRTIEWTLFQTRLPRTKARPKHKDIDALLPEVVGLLAGNDDKLLPVALSTAHVPQQDG
jgi:hypothetical protein